MSKKYSKILVTGGAGFIGSHLVDRLMSEGFSVTVLDNLSYGHMENLCAHLGNKELEFIKGDIRDQVLVKKVMQNVDVVFHEAALVSLTLSIQDPSLANEINVSGTVNLLKAASDSGVKRFVYASSAAVYSESQVPEKKETENSSPKTPYGVTKLADELYAKSFYQLYGLETVGLRYFNIYGPRQSCNLNAQYGGVIIIFLNRLLKELSPIIYGDGEQTRDFVNVYDIIQANMLAMNSPNARGQSFNIGSGIQITVNQVAKTLKVFLNKNYIENEYVDARPGEVKHGYADISQAKELLGYVSEISFEKGISDLVEWHVNRNNR
jgi:UDP-glucose 4-epimerase